MRGNPDRHEGLKTARSGPAWATGRLEATDARFGVTEADGWNIENPIYLRFYRRFWVQ